MTMSKFALFGKLTAAPGKRDELVALLLEAAKAMETADGCEQYIVHVADGDPDAVWVSERWRDEAAHAACLKREDVRAAISAGRPLIAKAEPLKLRALGGHGM